MAESTESLRLDELPDVILVKVMSNLNLTDRRSLMLTCLRMCDIFQHPSLWYHMDLELEGNYPRPEKLDRYRQMVEKVGSYCQELEFQYQGTYCKMDDDVREFIVNLSEKCRLETLVVSFDYANLKHKPRSNFIGPALKADIDTLCSIVSNCHRLTSFCIRKWPVFNHTDPSFNEILEALCENEKLKKLEKLHLFWPDRSETTWASVRTNQTCEYALKVVDNFKNLTHLSLMSNVVTEKLLNSLASCDRTQLLNMRIMVIYKSDMNITEIPDSAWKKLAGASPNLRTEMVFSSRVPSEIISVVLKPSAPVSTIHFMKFSRCGPEDLDRIAEIYHNCLEKFVDETDSSNAKQLVKLAHVCLKLHTMIILGPINYNTVIDLAEIKGKDWFRFCVDDKKIDMDDPVLGPDDDKVIKKNAQGEYYSVALHRWGDTDESLEKKSVKYQKMKAMVSTALGYKWEPLDVQN